MKIDFTRWAVFAPKDPSGVGREARDLRAVLGLGGHFIADSSNFTSAPPDGPQEVPLPRSLSTAEIVERLRAFPNLQGLVLFENISLHPDLLTACRTLGLATAAVIHWEWFNARDPQWAGCGLLIGPTAFTARVLAQLGFPKCCTLPWPLNLTELPERTIHGPARRFVHNSGFVDAQDRKGTADTLLAFERAKLPAECTLLVRFQKTAVTLPKAGPRVEIRHEHVATTTELYQEGDVFVQPSKMEGVGFQILEPVACGLPVITLDYPPMNEWVSQPELRVQPRWFQRRAFPTAWIPHAHLRLPRRADLARKLEWCATHDLTAISQHNRHWAFETFAPARVRSAWENAFAETFA